MLLFWAGSLGRTRSFAARSTGSLVGGCQSGRWPFWPPPSPLTAVTLSLPAVACQCLTVTSLPSLPSSKGPFTATLLWSTNAFVVAHCTHACVLICTRVAHVFASWARHPVYCAFALIPCSTDFVTVTHLRCSLGTLALPFALCLLVLLWLGCLATRVRCHCGCIPAAFVLLCSGRLRLVVPVGPCCERGQLSCSPVGSLWIPKHGSQ